jgi:hypothetical protein
VPVSIIGCAGFAIPKPPHLAQRPGGVSLLYVMASSVVKVVFVTMPMLIHFCLWSVPLRYALCGLPSYVFPQLTFCMALRD